MISASPILFDMIDACWPGRDAVVMDGCDVSTMIMRYPANSNQPEIKSWRRRILDLLRGLV